MKKKVILSSILSLAMCSSIAVGATFALFTSDSQTNVTVSSGTVKVTSTVSDLEMYSHEAINMTTFEGTKVARTEARTFLTGGTAKYEDGTLTLDKIVPGDGVTFNISVTNESDVAIKYRTIISSATGNGLINALNIKIDDTEYAGEAISEWTTVEATEETAVIDNIPVSIELPTTAGNAYQNRTVELSIAVEAVQGNAVEVVDEWDGATVETLSEDNVVDTAAELAAFAAAVNAGDNFVGKTVTLNANIDLAGYDWTSIGAAATPFAGTFDGKDYTISNLKLVGQVHTEGLFHTITADGSIKNVNLKNVSAVLAGKHTVGFLVATLQGKAENCNVTNATITHAVTGEGQYLISTGAMFGNVTATGAVDNCHANGVTITSTGAGQSADMVGGLIGNMENTAAGATVTNSSVANVTFNMANRCKKLGGFVGVTKNVTMENCTASNVNITVGKYYQYVGGFIGTATGNFTNCDVNGAVINVANGGGNQAAGGFVGRIFGTNTMKDCDVTALYITVSGACGGGVAGFCGEGNANGGTVTLENCSVVGQIEKVNVTTSGNGIVDTLIGNKWGTQTQIANISGNVVIIG